MTVQEPVHERTRQTWHMASHRILWNFHRLLGSPRYSKRRSGLGPRYIPGVLALPTLYPRDKPKNTPLPKKSTNKRHLSNSQNWSNLILISLSHCGNPLQHITWSWTYLLFNLSIKNCQSLPMSRNKWRHREIPVFRIQISALGNTVIQQALYYNIGLPYYYVFDEKKFWHLWHFS